MPAPRDLTGEAFGHLTVTKFAGVQPYAGKPRGRFWWCLCRCGREESIYQQFLVSGRVTECAICRRGPCAVCGGEIVEDTKRNTCSELCHVTKRRRGQLKHYAKQVAENPNHNKERWEERKQRMKENPALYESWLADERRRGRKKRSDPDRRARIREYYQQHYRKHREEIQERRKLRLAALPPEEKQRIEEKNRISGREWRRRWREEIKADPELYQEYLEYQREARNKYYAKKALGKLLSVGQELGDRFNDD